MTSAGGACSQATTVAAAALGSRRRTASRAIVGLVAAGMLATSAAPAHAQRWRTLTASRQRQSIDTLRLRATFGAGTLSLGAAPQALLYDIEMRSDADELRPAERYDPATQTLRIGSASDNTRLFVLDPRRMQFDDDDASGRERPAELTLNLARGIPLDLDLALGAAQGTVDFSGLWVSRLKLATGASEATVTFGTPNPQPMHELRIEVGAAGLTVRKLGNARARRITVNTGAAGADLDLSGAWEGETQIDLHVVLGGVTLHVPRDVGIVSRVNTRLGGLDASGLTQRDGAYYSANYASAKRKLALEGSATLGGIEIDRME